MSSFADELVKIAVDREQKSGWSPWARVGAGAAGAAVGAGVLLARRPLLRTHLVSKMRGMFVKGGDRAIDARRKLPKAVEDEAKVIAAELQARGIDFSKARIGISGTGGTGKSTMAKALAKQTKMKTMDLDAATSGLHGRDIPKYLKTHNVGPGTIAEQTHLLNQVDPDKFDVIIRLSKKPELIKKQLQRRGRGAGQWEVFNYRKLHKTIDAAVTNTKGEVISPVAGVHMKVRPRGGFKADETLNAVLSSKGINPAGLDRQQKLYSAVTGKRVTAPGITPIYRKGRMYGAAAHVPVGAGLGVGATYGHEAIQARKKQVARR